MNKKTRKTLSILVSLLVAVALLMSVTGCGKSSEGVTSSEKSADNAQTQSSAESKKHEPVELSVWSHLMEKEEVPVVKQIAEEWAKKTGNKVKVLFDQGTFQSYVQAANSSKGPDIMFGIAHDNLATFQKANLLAEVPADFIDKSKYPDAAIKAVTYGDKMFGVPIAIESIALFYNTDKVQNAPATWEEFIEQAKKVGFMSNITDMYMSYPFIAGNGAYIFKDNNGTLDPNDIGLGSENAKKAYEMMLSFVKEYKFMKADITGDIAKGNFQSGKIGLYIGGPWDVAGFQKAGTKFAVAPMPKMNGKVMPTFVGVQTAFVNSKSKNQEAAWDLLKYLIDNSSIPLFKAGNRIPALKSEQEKPDFKDNKIMAAFAEQASYGTPMPNIPELSACWTPYNNNMKLLLAGKTTPEKMATDIVNQIKEGIKTLNAQK